MSYKPLPHGLTILKSKIDGLGLFATQYILKNTVLGVIHVQDSRFENNYIRTPLGGFINHSEDPNLKSFSETDLKYIKTTKEINTGDELTLKYTLYKI
tara:strand:- start:1268 stop:1561 length:294 start_codon:yes stop_codon:yes gene_type:complete